MGLDKALLNAGRAWDSAVDRVEARIRQGEPEAAGGPCGGAQRAQAAQKKIQKTDRFSRREGKGDKDKMQAEHEDSLHAPR